MAKFKGELNFKVSFKDLGVPVGFGMTNAIIYHHCATEIGIRFLGLELIKNIRKTQGSK